MQNKQIKIVWQIGLLSTVSFVLVAGPLIGFWIGDWIDRRFSFDPYGKIVMIVLGLAGSVREIVRIVQKVLRDDSAR